MTIEQKRRFYHPLQKDYVTFLETSAETGGARTLLEVELAPGGGNGTHYHRSFSERFEVVSGELSVEVNGQTYVLRPGESATAEIGDHHRFFNASDEDVVFRVELSPGNVGFERGLQIVYGMAEAGDLTQGGLPRSLGELALILELTETGMPGPLRLMNPVAGALARRARRKGVEADLVARYCAW
jgi:quercetin dioxygenase-like cupin family protein